MRHTLAAILFITLISFVQAQEVSDGVSEGVKNVMKAEKIVGEAKICPEPSKPVGICGSIFGRNKDKDPSSSFIYDYQRIIYEASCVDYENDPETEISRKVRAMWDKHEKDIKCNSTQFDVQNGSFLKAAVKKMLRAVIEDAVMIWKVNLNRVDESDNLTVLDYVKNEIKRNEGNVLEPELKQYYKILIRMSLAN